MTTENQFSESGTSPTGVPVEVLAPEPAAAHVWKPAIRKKQTTSYYPKKTCYCCGRINTSPHHIIPRSEGGLPIFDNVVWLCPECHDVVEGPSVGARERLKERRRESKPLEVLDPETPRAIEIPEPKTAAQIALEKADAEWHGSLESANKKYDQDMNVAWHRYITALRKHTGLSGGTPFDEKYDAERSEALTLWRLATQKADKRLDEIEIRGRLC